MRHVRVHARARSLRTSATDLSTSHQRSDFRYFDQPKIVLVFVQFRNIDSKQRSTFNLDREKNIQMGGATLMTPLMKMEYKRLMCGRHISFT